MTTKIADAFDEIAAGRKRLREEEAPLHEAPPIVLTYWRGINVSFVDDPNQPSDQEQSIARGDPVKCDPSPPPAVQIGNRDVRIQGVTLELAKAARWYEETYAQPQHEAKVERMAKAAHDHALSRASKGILARGNSWPTWAETSKLNRDWYRDMIRAALAVENEQ